MCSNQPFVQSIRKVRPAYRKMQNPGHGRSRIQQVYRHRCQMKNRRLAPSRKHQVFQYGDQQKRGDPRGVSHVSHLPGVGGKLAAKPIQCKDGV